MVRHHNTPGRFASFVLVLCGTLLIPALLGDARAGAEPDDADRAAARRLFQEGRALMASGDYPQAQGKLEASRERSEGVGILYHLAECYEQLGRSASAWSLYREVATRTGAAGQAEREAEASARAAALKDRLSTLRIDGPADPVHGLEVRRDGQDVPVKRLGAAVPVDPGRHLVEATGPGGSRFSAQVDVAPDGDVAVVQIVLPRQEAPPIGAAQPPAKPSLRSELPKELFPPPNDGFEALEPVGWVLLTGGVVATAAGFALYAAGGSSVSEAEGRCETDIGSCSDADAVALHERGTTQQHVGLPLGIAGATSFVAGVVTLLAYNQANATHEAADVGVVVTPDRAFASLRVRW